MLCERGAYTGTHECRESLTSIPRQTLLNCAQGNATYGVVGSYPCSTWLTCLMLGVFHQKKQMFWEQDTHTTSINQVHIWWIYWVWTILFLTQHTQFTLGEMTQTQWILESHLMKSSYEKGYPAKFRLELDLHTHRSFIHELKGQATCRTKIWPPFSVMVILMPVEDPRRHQAVGILVLFT